MKVINRPSIGRYTNLEEPKARESLLTPAMRRSSSKTSLRSPESESTASFTTSSSGTALSTHALTQSAVSKPLPAEPSEFSPSSMVQAANAALMERPQFAIDNAGDEDDDDDDDDEEDEEDEVMDEVCPCSNIVALRESDCR